MQQVYVETASDNALTFLNGLDISALKLGLERIKRLTETLGNPQDALPTIHIAGTNGKGSTAAMLTSILVAAGYRVGTFTSPHLVDVRERIALDGVPISRALFEEEITLLAGHLDRLGWDREDWPTYFEFLNTMAYTCFQRAGVDIAVMEVGLGGRLDSTNIVKVPLVTVITSIGWDHMERLGNTLAAIAAEKAGICKAGAPLVLGPDIPEEALSVIHACARKAGSGEIVYADASRLVPEAPVAETIFQENGLKIRDERTGFTLVSPLRGTYQRQNISTVLSAVERLNQSGFNVPTEAVCRGIEQASWQGRFQLLPEQRLVVDGSHNPQGFDTLRESIQQYFSKAPLVWLLSLRSNRDPEALLSVVSSFPETRSVVWTQGKKSSAKLSLYHAPEAMAGITQKALASQISVHADPDVSFALQRFLEIRQQDPSAVGIVTGSLYTAGDVLRCLSDPDAMAKTACLKEKDEPLA